jgi:hypothetical protein
MEPKKVKRRRQIRLSANRGGEDEVQGRRGKGERPAPPVLFDAGLPRESETAGPFDSRSGCLLGDDGGVPVAIEVECVRRGRISPALVTTEIVRVALQDG